MLIIDDIHNFIKRKIAPGFLVGKNEIVVDLGSGDKPFWRGNVAVDNLKLDDNQRSSSNSTICNDNFVCADLHDLPFKDKVFDFSFCSHVLEHVEMPDLALNEIQRISKRGYIEVPNAFIEYLSPFNTHLWIIYRENGKLIFKRKTTQEHNFNKKNMSFIKRIRYKEPFIRFYWNDRFNYEIIDVPDFHKYYPSEINEKEIPTVRFRIYHNIYILILRLLRKSLVSQY